MVASPFEQRQGEFNRVIVPESADNLRAVAVLDANLPHERIVGNRHVALNVWLFLQSAVYDFRVCSEVKSLSTPNAPQFCRIAAAAMLQNESANTEQHQQDAIPDNVCSYNSVMVVLCR